MNLTSACCRTGFPLRFKPAANAGVMQFKSRAKKFMRFESVTALLNFSLVIFFSSLASFASADGPVS